MNPPPGVTGLPGVPVLPGVPGLPCVIVAAGRGSRLRGELELKPLVALRGTRLIERVIDRAMQAGVTDFLVVSGYRGQDLRDALDDYAARRGRRITHAINTEFERANGVSLLAARSHVAAPFLLTMCDHLVDAQILRDLMALDTPDCVTLAVDRNLANPLVDPDDVTRVQDRDGRIVSIGKLIDGYNCYDTGVFRCTSVVFDALVASQAAGDDSISGAMRVLAARGQARTMEIGGRDWIDVDDDDAFRRAEALIDAGRL